MSKSTERNLVLKMLESGTIDPDQAQNLLHAMTPNRDRNHSQADTIVVEMAADKDNVRNVLEKLGKAIIG
ncbi:MAG TPA: hypothetical protein VJ965_12125 [Anaerolineales bacterium]|nr:hypothetical protein [Anaerolineales bacterium]